MVNSSRLFRRGDETFGTSQARQTRPSLKGSHVVDERMASLPRDLVMEVIARFSIRELLVLAGVKEWSAIAHGELRSRVGALISKSELPVAETLKMMDDEDTIISGSGALFVCAPGGWVPKDIDFYCPNGGRDAVVRFLQAHGYAIIPKAGEEHAETTEAAEEVGGGSANVGDVDGAIGGEDTANEGGVVAASGSDGLADQDEGETDDENEPLEAEDLYSKHVMKDVVLLQKGGEGGPVANVIESILPCAEAPVFCFHSTIVMNVVTARGVICYYPQWTLHNEGEYGDEKGHQRRTEDINTGVVNRASGIRAWETKEKSKENDALWKYRDRGYVLHDDCEVLHGKGDRDCDACRKKMRNWDEGMVMTFNKGDTFTPTDRLFCWRLGEQPREKRKLFWRDRGTAIVVQGDGDGRAYVYDGRAKKTMCVPESTLRIAIGG